MFNSENKFDIDSDDDTPIISPGEFHGNLSHLADLPEYLEKVNQNILNIDKRISKKRISSSKPKDYERFHALRNKYLCYDIDSENIQCHNTVKSNIEEFMKSELNKDLIEKDKVNLDDNNIFNVKKFIKSYESKENSSVNSLKKRNLNKKDRINVETYNKMKNSFNKKKSLNNTHQLSQQNINNVNSLKKSNTLSEGRNNNEIFDFKKQDSLNKIDGVIFDKNKSNKYSLNKSYQVKLKNKIKQSELSATKLDKSLSKESDNQIKYPKTKKLTNIDRNILDKKTIINKNKLIKKNLEKDNIIVKKISPLKINLNKSNCNVLSHRNYSQQISPFSSILMPKKINVNDIMKMILFYNEYIVSHMDINENEKHIFYEFSSFLSKKILEEKKPKVNLINIDKQSQKNKSVIIIQRNWRKYYLNQIIRKKDLKFELKRNIIDNFIEKDVYETKKFITSLNFSFDNFVNTKDAENISIKLSKINDGKIDIQEKYIIYKEFINSYLKKENEIFKDEKLLNIDNNSSM